MTGARRARLAVAGVLLLGAAACNSGGTQAPADADPAQGSEPAAYTPPPEGTASLVAALEARRTEDGLVVVDGRLLLPASTRVWVDLFPVDSPPDADPIDRAELYLDPGGSFEAGPLRLPRDPRFRIQIVSHFTRSWQPPEVLALTGAAGTRLPKSALTLTDPSVPEAGGHLDHTSVLDVAAGPR